MSRKYHKNIIFTTSPLKGHYKFEDLFQFYPPDKKEIISYEKMTHFPVIIEYWIDENDKRKVSDPLFEGITPLVFNKQPLSDLGFSTNNPILYWFQLLVKRTKAAGDLKMKHQRRNKE